jgi:hypothetical protein
MLESGVSALVEAPQPSAKSSSKRLSEMGRANTRTKKRSAKAASSPCSGRLFDAPAHTRRGEIIAVCPRLNRRSLSRVSRLLRMAVEPAKTSSRNAMSASGNMPSVRVSKAPSRRRLRSMGPKSSGGSVKRPSMYSNSRPLSTWVARRIARLLAVPGGPMTSRCSRATAQSMSSSTTASRSTRPALAA